MEEFEIPSWVRTHALGFGAGSIQDQNWNDMIRVMRECGARTVLEIGCGFSTLCFDRAGLFVTCLETKLNWINHVDSQTSDNIFFVHYAYPYLPEEFPDGYDVAFVDGPSEKPAASDGRVHAMAFVADRTKRVFVHDSRRKPEVRAISEVFPNGEWIQTVYDGGLSLFIHESLDEDYVKPKKKKKQ